MNCLRKPASCVTGLFLVAVSFPTETFLFANDSAAEVAVGGIQLRKEARISMEKERLTISLKKVTVEYEFLNSTDQDVSTEVAFPIPPYKFTPESAGGVRDFDDFRVWIEGRGIKYQTDVRAKLKGIDHTALLRRLGLDIQSFARFPDDGDFDVTRSQIGKLSVEDRQKLLELGMIRDDGFPLWTVHKTYHWHQLFLAQKTVHVRHEYAPAVGFGMVSTKFLREDKRGFCVGPSLEKTLAAQGIQGFLYPQWITYILTTANTWKTPIKDFELVVVESNDFIAASFSLIHTSVCGVGGVQRVGKSRLVVRKTNFVPNRELGVTLYFYDQDSPRRERN